MKFIAFSDSHIGGKFNEQMFLKGVEYINSNDADFYIFCGDLTDQGTLAEYELTVNKYLPMFEKHILMVPGNHDVKNVGDLLWEEYIGPRFFVHVDGDKRVKVLGLDSNEPDMNTGRMGRKAINRIYQEFQDLDDDWFKVLVFHHQSLPIKYTGRERSALNDAGDTIKAIMDNDINLVLNGHRHISNVYRLTDGDQVSMIVNCGTISCKKTRYKEEFSVTEIEIDEHTLDATAKVHLLGNDKVIDKFDGSLVDTVNPKRPRNLLATIVQIGNTDFSSGDFNLENYARATQLINSMDECDIVVHNGDVTSGSYKEDFEMAKALLNQIHKPLVVVPGPRDYYAIGQEYYADYIGDYNITFEHDNLKLLAFNSCILEEKIGRLGRSRSRQIINELKDDERLGAVAFHHTIIPLPRTKHESELQDAGDVLALLVENKINLILTGAKNRAGCWQVDDSVFVNAGTVSSKNFVTKKGNSYNIIKIYKTKEGKFYRVQEVFLESGEFEILGEFHVHTE